MKKKIPYKDIFGQNVEYYYKSKGLTQMELARKTGLNFVSINEIINDESRNVTLATMVKVAEALEVDLYDLLRPRVLDKFETYSELFWNKFFVTIKTSFPDTPVNEDNIEEIFKAFYTLSHAPEDASLQTRIWNERSIYLNKSIYEKKGRK